MKVFILCLSFLFPESSFASVENLESLIQNAELTQQELAAVLGIIKVTNTFGTSEMAEALPRSQIADAQIDIKLKPIKDSP